MPRRFPRPSPMAVMLSRPLSKQPLPNPWERQPPGWPGAGSMPASPRRPGSPTRARACWRAPYFVQACVALGHHDDAREMADELSEVLETFEDLDGVRELGMAMSMVAGAFVSLGEEDKAAAICTEILSRNTRVSTPFPDRGIAELVSRQIELDGFELARNLTSIIRNAAYRIPAEHSLDIAEVAAGGVAPDQDDLPEWSAADRIRLAEVLAGRGQVDTAYDIAKSVLHGALRDQDAAGVVTSLEIVCALGEPEETPRLLNLIEAQPLRAMLFARLADRYRQAGRDEEAGRAAEEALRSAVGSWDDRMPAICTVLQRLGEAELFRPIVLRGVDEGRHALRSSAESKAVTSAQFAIALFRCGIPDQADAVVGDELCPALDSQAEDLTEDDAVVVGEALRVKPADTTRLSACSPGCRSTSARSWPCRSSSTSTRPGPRALPRRRPTMVMSGLRGIEQASPVRRVPALVTALVEAFTRVGDTEAVAEVRRGTGVSSPLCSSTSRCRRWWRSATRRPRWTWSPPSRRFTGAARVSSRLGHRVRGW